MRSDVISLSPREREVVRGLAQGKQVRDVAEPLGISTNTAAAHLYHAVRKLNVNGRAELVLAAIQHGVIPCPCAKHASNSKSAEVRA
jgi:two-component system nitrate/nitrite response regulator NarL